MMSVDQLHQLTPLVRCPVNGVGHRPPVGDPCHFSGYCDRWSPDTRTYVYPATVVTVVTVVIAGLVGINIALMTR